MYCIRPSVCILSHITVLAFKTFFQQVYSTHVTFDKTYNKSQRIIFSCFFFKFNLYLASVNKEISSALRTDSPSSVYCLLSVYRLEAEDMQTKIIYFWAHCVHADIEACRQGNSEYICIHFFDWKI